MGCGCLAAVLSSFVGLAVSGYVLLFTRPVDGSSPTKGAKIVAVCSIYLAFNVGCVVAVARFAFDPWVLHGAWRVISWIVS